MAAVLSGKGTVCQRTQSHEWPDRERGETRKRSRLLWDPNYCPSLWAAAAILLLLVGSFPIRSAGWALPGQEESSLDPGQRQWVGAALPYGHLPHNKTQLDMCPPGLAMPLLANVQDFGFPPSLLATAMPMDLPTLKANKTHTLAKWMLAASPCLPSTTSTPESYARACQGLPAWWRMTQAWFDPFRVAMGSSYNASMICIALAFLVEKHCKCGLAGGEAFLLWAPLKLGTRQSRAGRAGWGRRNLMLS